MKRSSILYDYKPRLEWTDPALLQKKKRQKSIIFVVCFLIMTGIFSFVLQPATILSQRSQSTFSGEHFSRELKLSKPAHITLNNGVVPSVKQGPDPNVQVSDPRTGVFDQGKYHNLPFEPDARLQLVNKQPSNSEVTTTTDESSETSGDEDWRTVTVKEGDNLSLIFSRLAISKNDLYQILSLGEETDSLKRLLPGQILRLKFDESSKVEELVHESDLTHTLQVKKSEDKFEAEVIEEKPIVKVAKSSGSIHDSLFISGQKAGLSDNIIMQMFEIFGWDIDFVLDIREDDEFHVIYEELYKNGEKIKDGAVLAAEFVNQGKSYKAVRYSSNENHTGYYSEDGNRMKKAFLRTPVNFTRISSHFNLNRKHPVLNKIRAHKGVDYAAPSGTPVKSTGNGKIVFVGSKNGYGNTVVIEHGGKYSTLYAHLSRFTRGLKKGNRVKQGQTIAYVGQTGLATGPHLHYEFRIGGVHANPVTVALPKSLPLPKKYRKDFFQQTRPLLAQLDSISAETKYHAEADKTESKDSIKIKLASREQQNRHQSAIN